jgi:hypothetical protein
MKNDGNASGWLPNALAFLSIFIGMLVGRLRRPTCDALAALCLRVSVVEF